MAVVGDVKDFLRDKGYISTGDQVNDEDSLLENGIIDSIVIMELVLFLEEKYGMQISEDDLMPENFDSLRAIRNYVGKNRA